MIPLRDENPTSHVPVVTLAIIALNVLAFLVWEPTLGNHSPLEQETFFFCYAVIPYEVMVPTAEYIAYLDDYVLPQLAGWSEEGILASHAVFLARYPAGRPWQSLLVLEYRNDQALAARDAVVAKVRARLTANAKWKAVSENKKNARAEKTPVLADPAPARQIP